MPRPRQTRPRRVEGPRPRVWSDETIFNYADHGYGSPGWGTLRAAVYERDNGYCQVCLRFTPLEDYDLGHLRDRACGGLDVPENLVVMCQFCNRILKPLHASIEAARAWIATDPFGAWIRSVVSRKMPEALDTPLYVQTVAIIRNGYSDDLRQYAADLAELAKERTG